MTIAAARQAHRASSPADVGRAAVRALHAELTLYPKPGLVSPVDRGAHDDMDAATFQRSLFVLRHAFVELASAGAAGAPFAVLSRIGVAAERRMLAATGGVNTHRGAIFSMGLLAAAAGFHQARGLRVSAEGLAGTVVRRWGQEIAAAAPAARGSNGEQVVRRHGVRGARDEALAGFPILVGTALPVLRRTLAAVGCRERALVQTLFAVMAELEDTNVVHRGGMEGLAWLQGEARRFLEGGGTHAPGWRERAVAIHRQCVTRWISPGGAADVLAAALFVHELST
jgi:triphosphoribosyl-dephospho-CoA synthase